MHANKDVMQTRFTLTINSYAVSVVAVTIVRLSGEPTLTDVGSPYTKDMNNRKLVI